MGDKWIKEVLVEEHEDGTKTYTAINNEGDSKTVTGEYSSYGVFQNDYNDKAKDEAIKGVL